MTTPNKLSLKKKHRRAPIVPPGDCIIITDSDDEKENADKVGVAGSFRTKYRTPRRDSTILAGNLTMLDQSTAMVEPKQQSNITVRRSRGSKRDSKELTPLPARPAPRLSVASVMTEDLTIPPQAPPPQDKTREEKFVSPKSSAGVGGLVTEDESDFYSCQGSPTNPMNLVMQETWMTDITTKSEKDRKKAAQIPTAKIPPAANLASPPRTHLQTPQGGSIFKKPQGSTVRAAAFFSVEKRRTVFGQLGASNAILAGGSDSDSSPEKRIQPAKLLFTGQLERTVVASSDDQITEDEDTPVVSARPHLVSDSDDDVPLVQLGRDFLSETQFGKIVGWVHDSPFSSKLELSRTTRDSASPGVSDHEIDSLLKSDPEDGDVRPSWAAPLPETSVNKTKSFSERTSKLGGSWNKTGTQSGIGWSEGTSKAGGSWNKTGTEASLGGESEGTSKAGESWNKTGTGVPSSMGLSDRTSKAGGSWNKTGTEAASTMGLSERTSKARGSWNTTGASVPSTAGLSERTSKAGGSWNTSNSKAGAELGHGDSERTSKSGGNMSASLDSKQTSKGGRNESKTVGKDKSPILATGADSNLSSIQGGVPKPDNKAGKKKLNDVDLDGTFDDFDKLRLSGRGSGDLRYSGSGENTSNLGENEDGQNSSNNVSKVKTRDTSCNKASNNLSGNSSTNAKTLGSTKTSQVPSSTKTSQVPSTKTVNSTKTSKVPSIGDKSKSATQSSFHLQLSLSQSDDVDPSFTKTNKSLNLDGAPPPTNSQSRSTPSNPTPLPLPPHNEPNGSILQTSYVKGPTTLTKSKLPPIENSVNAVRSWTQVTQSQTKPKSQHNPDSEDVQDVWGQLSIGSGEPQSQVSEGVEKCNIEGKATVIDESDSEEDLEKFLVNLKSKKKPTKLISSDDSDDNFVVPDNDIDSDEFATPKLSLKDRIKARTKPDISTHRKPRVPSPGTETDSDSLPDIDSKGSSTNEEEPKKGKKKLPKTRPGQSVKKVHVIYSDSEEEDEATPVHHISSDDDNDQSFVNIYEPGSYHLVPPPSTPIVIPPTRKKPRTKKPKVPAGTESKTPKTKPLQVYQDQNFSTPTLTFLSSLTMDTPVDRCHPSALPYLKNFPKQKTELAGRLYTLYNTQCFDNALPEDMEITWNVRLTKTAGLCYSRRHRNRHNIEVRSSRIELSTKVIDSGDRLRDTLIHEMCHAASWIISGYRDGHGPLWRTWAEKAMGRFPELPVIDRCHSYQIRTKYTYRCEKCGYSIGRHSKSLDTEKKVCGHCYGRFQLVVNGKTVQTKVADGATAAGAAPAKPKAPNAFALFVKENYKVYKQPGVTHGDVMKMLSSKFSATKISK